MALTTLEENMTETDRPSRPPLALLANDQEWSARSLESILGPHGYAVLRAHTGRQALEMARTSLPDVVVVDARLPDIDGIDVCRTLRQDPRFSATTPIVITSAGEGARAQRLAAYKAGAWEFCTQPLDGEALVVKLDTFMRCKREVDRVRAESLLDERTGLYNMRGLARRAQEIGSDAFRRHDALACLAVAPDTADGNGGEIGAAAAERVTERVSQLFKTKGRVSDAIGRLGSLEFAIIAPATNAEGARRLVARLQGVLEETLSADASSGLPMRIRAGYCAVPNFAEASVDAVEMLLRAATALHHTRQNHDDALVTSFDELPARATP
ncbi:MAG TPA: response regulator [Gemmatimonadaceae bacterium]|nr:response regulator [Gemmatimonadaceae bacterium]